MVRPRVTAFVVVACAASLLCAGPLAAGPWIDGASGASSSAAGDDAIVARYRVTDDRGGHDMTLVRSVDRIEYRIEGDPIRLWTREAEGISLQEIYPAARRDVVYTPGELRTLSVAPDWRQLTELIAPELRASLTTTDTGKTRPVRFGEPVVDYGGKDARAIAVDLQWLPGIDLPLRYSREADAGKDALTLVALERMPAAQAFTALDDLQDIDHADLGDMELDPFVRSLPHARAHATP